MTTSKETQGLDFGDIRKLIDAAHALSLDDRTTLLKGLIPCITSELSPQDFEAFMLELRLIGERWYDAAEHPGQGRDTRDVPGERSLEGR